MRRFPLFAMLAALAVMAISLPSLAGCNSFNASPPGAARDWRVDATLAITLFRDGVKLEKPGPSQARLLAAADLAQAFVDGKVDNPYLKLGLDGMAVVNRILAESHSLPATTVPSPPTQ